LAIHSKLESREAYAIHELAKAYGMPALLCDEGCDYLKVYETFRKASVLVRKNQAPCFIEVTTYRYREHVGPGEDFQAGYRTGRELKKWRAQDPLCQNNPWEKKYRSQIENEIDEAIRFAEQSPFPDQEELLAQII
jgi:TPP-dependent pyruvate/acetoin dehydrogenase alpha subunit